MLLDDFEIIQGNAREVLSRMPKASVHCCITSPPYWGLRDYGVAPQAWGGDPSHDHVWGREIYVNATNHVDQRRRNHDRNGRGEEQPVEKRPASHRLTVGQGHFCGCGAWRGALGLEPTPELYVGHLVEIFREMRRVLRDDGTLWLNLGDSYSSGNRRTYDQTSVNKGKRGSVWTIATEPYPKAHFATDPRALVMPCVKASTSARGCCPQCGAHWRRVVERTSVRPVAYDGKWREADPQASGRRMLANVRARRRIARDALPVETAPRKRGACCA